MAGTVDPTYAKGYRAICLCDDCQAYAHHIQRTDVLDTNGGTDVFPITPARLKITKGLEHLRCVRLSPNGMYRWYAGCCNSPIANTPASQALGYVGVVNTILEKKNSKAQLVESFGPIQARIQGRFGRGELPPKTSQTVAPAFLLRVLKFVILGWVRGDKRPSPFFDRDGRPVVQPYVLSKKERMDLRTDSLQTGSH